MIKPLKSAKNAKKVLKPLKSAKTAKSAKTSKKCSNLLVFLFIFQEILSVFYVKLGFCVLFDYISFFTKCQGHFSSI